MRKVLVGMVAVCLMATPSYAEEARPYHELSLGTGFHMGAQQILIYGISYRHGINELLSFAAGIEAGQTPFYSLVPGLTYAPPISPIVRLHVAAITNSWIYAGLGATYTQVLPSSGTIADESAASIEAIGGMHFPIGWARVGAEVRAGLTGPSTALLSAGGSL